MSLLFCIIRVVHMIGSNTVVYAPILAMCLPQYYRYFQVMPALVLISYALNDRKCIFSQLEHYIDPCTSADAHVGWSHVSMVIWSCLFTYQASKCKVIFLHLPRGHKQSDDAMRLGAAFLTVVSAHMLIMVFVEGQSVFGFTYVEL
jgi:hypothetical protein